jgi:AraC-like DNA-binding protein
VLSTFSLDAVPAPLRPQALRDAFGQNPMPVQVRFRRTTDVRAAFATAALGRVRVERFSVQGVTGTALRELTTDDTAVEPAITLHWLHRGALTVHHDDQAFSLTPRSMSFTSADLPLRMTQDHECVMTTITVPYQELRLPVSAIRAALNRPFDDSEPVAATVVALVDRLTTDLADAPDQPWEVMEQAVIGLMRALVLLTTGNERAARGPLAESLGERIVAYIDRHALDGSLDAAHIAAAHSISVRYLYLILRRREVSLGEHIRSRRLDHAAKLLSDPAAAHLSIAEIAYRSGFADQAHFSRTFGRRFDVPPREWRLRTTARTRAGVENDA